MKDLTPIFLASDLPPGHLEKDIVQGRPLEPDGKHSLSYGPDDLGDTGITL